MSFFSCISAKEMDIPESAISGSLLSSSARSSLPVSSVNNSSEESKTTKHTGIRMDINTDLFIKDEFEFRFHWYRLTSELANKKNIKDEKAMGNIIGIYYTALESLSQQFNIQKIGTEMEKLAFVATNFIIYNSEIENSVNYAITKYKNNCTIIQTGLLSLREFLRSLKFHSTLLSLIPISPWSYIASIGSNYKSHIDTFNLGIKTLDETFTVESNPLKWNFLVRHILKTNTYSIEQILENTTQNVFQLHYGFMIASYIDQHFKTKENRSGHFKEHSIQKKIKEIASLLILDNTSEDRHERLDFVSSCVTGAFDRIRDMHSSKITLLMNREFSSKMSDFNQNRNMLLNTFIDNLNSSSSEKCCSFNNQAFSIPLIATLLEDLFTMMKDEKLECLNKSDSYDIFKKFKEFINKKETSVNSAMLQKSTLLPKAISPSKPAKSSNPKVPSEAFIQPKEIKPITLSKPLIFSNQIASQTLKNKRRMQENVHIESIREEEKDEEEYIQNIEIAP